MKDAQKYYEVTKESRPHKLTQKFINMKIIPDKAIDFGCGAGRDTVYLIKNGWKVLAIDKENSKEYIDLKLNEEERKKFKFQCQDFENIKLEKVKLIVANFSIPFCSKDKFKDLWNSITQNIIQNGYFVGNFFGLKDSWAYNKDKKIFLSKDEVLKLFESSFEIIDFQEIEKDGETALNGVKHWHIYNIIARKK